MTLLAGTYTQSRAAWKKQPYVEQHHLTSTVSHPCSVDLEAFELGF